MPITTEKRPFTAAHIATAPDQTGVYALYDGGAVIYYGRATTLLVTIRSRLSDHFSGRDGPCTQRAEQFNYEVRSDAEARERQLLLEHQRLYGRLPRCNDRIG